MLANSNFQKIVFQMLIRTDAVFPLLQDGVKHYRKYLDLVPPLNLNVHVLTAATDSNIFFSFLYMWS